MLPRAMSLLGSLCADRLPRMMGFLSFKCVSSTAHLVPPQAAITVCYGGSGRDCTPPSALLSALRIYRIEFAWIPARFVIYSS